MVLLIVINRLQTNNSSCLVLIVRRPDMLIGCVAVFHRTDLEEPRD